MKKLLCICAALWLLFALCAAPVFAAEDSCMICDDFDEIVFRGKTYVPVDLGRAELLGETEVTLSGKYENEEIRKKYEHTKITYVEEQPHILCVSLMDTYDHYTLRYYVEESRVEEVQNFLEYETNGQYTTESEYWDIESFVMDGDDIYNWLTTGKVVTSPANKMQYCISHPLYWEDPGVGLYTYIGDIFLDYDENGNEIFYLLYFPFYEEYHFYGSGSYAIDSTLPTYFIRLTDEELTEELAVYYATVPEEDELDWVVPGDVPEEVASVIALILFGILPVALMAFALVWIFVKQPKNPYFAALCVIIFAAAEVAIAYVALALLLQ